MPVVRRRENYGIVSDHWILNFLKACVAAAASVWLTIPVAIQVLAVVCAFDLASCLLTHRSSMRDTLRRVAVTLLLCGCIMVVYTMAKDVAGFSIAVGPVNIGTAVVIFYIAGELLEITLNCSTVIRISPKLLEWLEKAQGMTGAQKKQVAALKDVERISHDAL